jgi:hypothetical protein
VALRYKNSCQGIILEVSAVNAGENDSAHTGLPRNPRAGLMCSLDLAAFAIDLVADEVVIME